ncbi:MAG: hypothetical protein EI684_07595 [Candidatus Viridilinea halotolerans]|uniref:Glycosyltransferase RgtA/B/C/D-like domain-containing protein n=1 Tax=Candidatus Viridilinea halotolerans TaxID=2491704 RepID=A0A426U332_9CHLR|nr:MAG: hypothetical protein EI684_07595 [Candidatus Viridilinea halotolerans]
MLYSGVMMPATSSAALHAVGAKRKPYTRPLGWGDALVLGLLLTFWLAVMMLSQRTPVVYALDLTEPTLDERFYYIGLHTLEQNEQFVYRWTSDQFTLQLPAGYHMASRYVVTLRAQAGLPAAHPLLFLSNERPLATTVPGGAFRRYQVLLPPAPPRDSELRFGLQTTPRSQAGDERPLGVVVTDVALRGLPERDGAMSFGLPMAFALLWGLARWRGASLLETSVHSGILALALLGLFLYRQPAPLPYPAMAGLSLVAAGVAILSVRETWVRVALGMLATIVSFSGMLWSNWLSDDVFISFRYAQNLVAGNGLVYNPGEYVEGYTNFLYTMLAALLLSVGADPVAWTYRSGVGFALGLLLLTYLLAKRLIGPRWAFVAALLVATSQSLLLHTARGGGLETGLFALLLLLAVAIYVAWLEGGCGFGALGSSLGVVLALATLTRPEGLLLLGITGLHYLIYDMDGDVLRQPWAWMQRKLGALIFVLPYLLLIVPFFLWRYNYYGDLLPNTFYAKTGGGLRAVPRGLAYSWQFAQTMGGPLLLLALLGWLEVGWRSLLRGWRGYFLLLVLIYTAYIITVGGDHFRGERFFVPLVAPLAMLFADGLAQVTRRALRRPTLRWATQILLVIFLTSYSAYALTRTHPIDYIMRGMDESVWIWRELGWWMADHTTPDESIAVLGAGAIAYYGQRTTIDMHGLTDYHIARIEVPEMGSGTAGHEKADPLYVINVRQPTYIPAMWDGYFPDRALLEAHYELITIRTRLGRDVALWRRIPTE